MGIAAAFFGELISILLYVILAVGVFKLFQVVTLLGDIKELLGRRAASEGASFPLAAAPVASTPMADLRANDDAAEYAAKLLRAVNSESHTTTDAPFSESR
jgi:hypothetical protein